MRIRAKASRELKDMDFVNFYHDTAVMSFLQLEGLSFFGPGGGERPAGRGGAGVRLAP